MRSERKERGARGPARGRVREGRPDQDAPAPLPPPSGGGWRREEGGALILALHVQPGVRRTEVAGVHGEGAQARLRIRLAAPPLEGRANAELLRFLGDAFGVPLRSVTLVRGEGSRQKVVRIELPVRRPDVAW